MSRGREGEKREGVGQGTQRGAREEQGSNVGRGRGERAVGREGGEGQMGGEDGRRVEDAKEEE